VDRVEEHYGVIASIEGGMETATIISRMPNYVFPRKRINATGGFNWQTTPQTINFNGNIVHVQRAGLR
jgi:succinyl-CoA synthetase beta subunit